MGICVRQGLGSGVEESGEGESEEEEKAKCVSRNMSVMRKQKHVCLLKVNSCR